MSKNFKVWTCKIVVDADDLPPGFDSPPRIAAQKAIENAGFEVLMNCSGWGGSLTKADAEYLENNGYKKGSDLYYAGVGLTPKYYDGVMNAPEDSANSPEHSGDE